MLIVSAGCGAGHPSRPTAHLQGTVKVDGQPIPDNAEASITFKPTASGQAKSTSAQIIKGKYDAPDVPRGNVTIYFNVQEPTGRQVREGMGNPYAEMRSLVPEKLGLGMALQVDGDKADQDFDLK